MLSGSVEVLICSTTANSHSALAPAPLPAVVTRGAMDYMCVLERGRERGVCLWMYDSSVFFSVFVCICVFFVCLFLHLVWVSSFKGLLFFIYVFVYVFVVRLYLESFYDAFRL